MRNPDKKVLRKLDGLGGSGEEEEGVDEQRTHQYGGEDIGYGVEDDDEDEANDLDPVTLRSTFHINLHFSSSLIYSSNLSGDFRYARERMYEASETSPETACVF